MDLTWLVIPVAMGLFLARTAMLARRLKLAAANPTLADRRAFREAQRSLNLHRTKLEAAVAERRTHLEAERRLSRPRPSRGRASESRVARMVEESMGTRRS